MDNMVQGCFEVDSGTDVLVSLNTYMVFRNCWISCLRGPRRLQIVSPRNTNDWRCSGTISAGLYK